MIVVENISRRPEIHDVDVNGRLKTEMYPNKRDSRCRQASLTKLHLATTPNLVVVLRAM